MFVQPLVEDAHGQAVRLDDTLGSWFAVVGFRADPAEHTTEAQRGYLARVGEPRPCLQMGTEWERTLKHYTSLHIPPNVVVRPRWC